MSRTDVLTTGTISVRETVPVAVSLGIQECPRVPVPGLQDEFDVDAFITSDLSEIRVDRFIYEQRPSRYRFSLAHELAHLLIHKDVFKELSFLTIKEWKNAITSIEDQQYFFIERQAYALGGLILVPAVPLRDLFDTKIKEASAAGIDLHDLDESGRRVVENNIGLFFGVSADVISRRMKKDQLWR